MPRGASRVERRDATRKRAAFGSGEEFREHAADERRHTNVGRARRVGTRQDALGERRQRAVLFGGQPGSADRGLGAEDAGDDRRGKYGAEDDRGTLEGFAAAQHHGGGGSF